MTNPQKTAEIRKCQIQYRVPYADTDQMGYVYYANYFVYYERLRNELLRSTGVPYREWEKRGMRLPVIEAHCEYLAPAFYDDLLAVQGWVSEVRPVRLRIDYEIIREDQPLARGYTVHACLSQEGRPVRLPAEIRALAPETTEGPARPASATNKLVVKKFYSYPRAG